MKRRGVRAAAVCAAALVAACGDGGAGGPAKGGGAPAAAPPPGAPPIARAPDELRRLRNLGRLHFERESEEGYLAAVETLRQAVALPGADFDDRLNLARALLSAQDGAEEADRTLRALESALPAAARPAELDYAAGLARKRLEDLSGARERFARVTEKRPRHRHGWLQLGRVAFLQNDFAAADAAFLRALDVDPRLRAAAYHRTMIAERTGRPADEVAAARKAFEAIPEAGQPDAERCDLTRVTLRPVRRADAEPPEPALSFAAATHRLLGDGLPRAVRDVAVVDADGDGREELWLLSSEGVRAAGLGGGPREVAGGGGTRLVAGDLDNDGRLDAVVGRDAGFVVAFDALGAESQPTVVPAAGETLDLLLVDLDHDGDLDVVRARSAGPTAVETEFHRHNGDRTFAPPSAVCASVRREARGAFRLDFHDFDQGNDVDLALPGADGARIVLNRRSAGFADAFVGTAKAAGAVVRAEDLDGDGAPDLAVGGAEGVVVVPNGDAFGDRGAFRSGATRSFAIEGGVRDLALEDVDRDGDRDFVLATADGLVLLRNTGPAQPERRAEDAPSGALRTSSRAERVVAADLNGDGAAELVAVGEDGVLTAFESRATPSYAGWTVRPEGRQDNRGAVGAVVEQMCGALYASAMIKGPTGVRFGLGPGGRAAIDGLRLRFPQGVVQSLIGADVGLGENGVARFLQREGLVASCPFLYARGPRGVAFLTDAVGIAPLDEWLPPGATPALDPEEFVRIDDDALDVRDGRVVLHLTEELRETTYLDRVELVAVEHPTDVELHLDESTRQGAYDPLAVYARPRGTAVAPATVRLPGGVEAGAAAAAKDGDYVRGYPEPRSQWPGWVGRYDLELTTPVAASSLYLTGRIAWYDSTSAYALHQSGRGFGPLRLEELRADGTVRTLVGDLGVPAGMDRTIVATWDGPLAAGARVRLSGAHRFLWDRLAFGAAPMRVAFDDRSDSAALPDGRTLRRVAAPLAAAKLGFHGFSAVRGDRASHGQTYDFAAAAPDDAFPRAAGLSTRYGDVRPLLTEHDDRLVVLVAGDAVALTFDAPSPPSAGSARTWFLRVTGWAKESGFHNRTGRDIAPLPFRGMTRYPPPPGESPQSTEYAAYLAAYQTRVVR